MISALEPPLIRAKAFISKEPEPPAIFPRLSSKPEISELLDPAERSAVSTFFAVASSYSTPKSFATFINLFTRSSETFTPAEFPDDDGLFFDVFDFALSVSICFSRSEICFFVLAILLLAEDASFFALLYAARAF